MLRTIITSFVGAVFWAAIMPDLMSLAIVNVIWGIACGVFWAVQDNKMDETRRLK